MREVMAGGVIPSKASVRALYTATGRPDLWGFSPVDLVCDNMPKVSVTGARIACETSGVMHDWRMANEG